MQLNEAWLKRELVFTYCHNRKEDRPKMKNLPPLGYLKENMHIKT